MADETKSDLEANPGDTLTAEQKENLEKGYPLDDTNDPISKALEDLNKDEPTAKEEPAQEDTPAQEESSGDITLPDGTVVTTEQFNNFLERARAMEVLEQHPDVLDKAIEAIKGHQGELYQPSEKDGEEGDTVSGQRIANLESAMVTLANQIALQNAAASPDAPSDLQSEAQKILSEAPGLSVEQAVAFAKDRISARSSAGKDAPPVTTSERSGGASNNNSEASSISEAIAEAQQKIKGAKSPDKAADTAIAEAIRIEAMKEEQRGGM